MIHYLRNKKLLHFFWGLLALFMLNISIDSPDDNTRSGSEDLSFNEQESIIEYVLEEMMGIEDAIPESEDNDASQNSTLKKTAGLDCFIVAPVPVKPPVYPFSLRKQYWHQPDASGSSRYIEIVSPPPEIG